MLKDDEFDQADQMSSVEIDAPSRSPARSPSVSSTTIPNPGPDTIASSNDSAAATSAPVQNPIIAEQQKLIHFEPYDFKLPSSEITTNFERVLDHEQSSIEQNSTDDSMMQAAIRRQSLFKLKENMKGKVNKHVSDIEKRKLSPYRFSHSPLKQPKKMFKV